MKEPVRVVSLLASGTELVCALGLGERLVGRSHECDFPTWVRRLPEVSRPTFPIDGSSREIDEHVRTRLREGRALYVVDEDELRRLGPELVLTQTHCRVCAVTPAELERAGSAQPWDELVMLASGSLQAIIQGFVQVAEALGRPEAGRELARALRGKLARVSEQAAGLPRPLVACLEWIEPTFAMGNWGPALVEVAGGRSALGEVGASSRVASWSELVAADPDVVVVAPCGWGLARASSEMHTLTQQPAFASLRAVRNGQLFVADGNRYFNRSSPSLFETPAILAEMLHPEHFEPRHEGTAWARHR